jgi:hypothetical protein
MAIQSASAQSSGASTSATTTTASTTTTRVATTSTVAPSVPGTPTNLVVQITGSYQLTIRWDRPVIAGGPGLQYRLYVSVTAKQGLLVSEIVVPGTATSYVLNVGDLPYTFAIRAENTLGASPISPVTEPISVPDVEGPIVPASLPDTTVPSSEPVSPTTPSATMPPTTVAQSATAGDARQPTTAPPTSQSSGQPATTAPSTVSPKRSLPIEPVTSSPATTKLSAAKPCALAPWSAALYGRPESFADGADQGVFVWFDGTDWQVRLYHPGPNSVRFTASITANAPIRSSAIGLERGETIKRRSASATYSGTSNYDVDGLTISAGCASRINLGFTVDGKPVPLSRIHLGLTSTGSAQKSKTRTAQIVLAR